MLVNPHVGFPVKGALVGHIQQGNNLTVIQFKQYIESLFDGMIFVFGNGKGKEKSVEGIVLREGEHQFGFLYHQGALIGYHIARNHVTNVDRFVSHQARTVEFVNGVNGILTLTVHRNDTPKIAASQQKQNSSHSIQACKLYQ